MIDKEICVHRTYGSPVGTVLEYRAAKLSILQIGDGGSVDDRLSVCLDKVKVQLAEVRV